MPDNRDHEPPAIAPPWAPEGSEWDWTEEEYPDGGVRLTFVRGVTADPVIEAFGADPSAARLLSAEATDETLGYPWIRVGRTGEWAFAIDTCPVDVYENETIAADLSAGTELALAELTLSSELFYYFVDRTEVTSFEPLLARDRDGSDPDRFVQQMRQAGLRVDPRPDDGDHELERSPRIALLDMLTLALGIRLSREVAVGPLLTVQPGSA
jgi:hypothetical protein